MKELVNAYKLVQYGLALKKQLGFAALFGVIGIVLEVAGRANSLVGGFYVILSSMFVYQLIISVDMSTLIQSSPYKKKIQCTYPLIAVVPWVYVMMTVVILLHAYFGTHGTPEEYQMQCMTIVTLGALLCVVMIYFAFAYKYFIVSMIIMMLCVFAVMGGLNEHSPVASLFDSMGVSIAAAYLLTTVGFIAAWILTRVVYKAEMSKMAFRTLLNNKNQ
ncbi:MAG: hypothetical protein K5891_11490 [Lachnospiraceae bacterium]|nr:hypothetical protein [Lachnospiraceae bacterium]